MAARGGFTREPDCYKIRPQKERSDQPIKISEQAGAVYLET